MPDSFSVFPHRKGPIMPEPDVTISTRDDLILVTSTAVTLDEQAAQSLFEQAQAAADMSPVSAVILNLASVESMPSMAIGALVTLWKKLQETRQRLVIVGMRPAVRNTLAVCRLDKLFEFCDTEATAISRLRPGSV